MSRVGRLPIPIPGGVDVAVADHTVRVKGPKGSLQRTVHPDMTVAVADGRVTVSRPSDSTRPPSTLAPRRSVPPTRKYERIVSASTRRLPSTSMRVCADCATLTPAVPIETAIEPNRLVHFNPAATLIFSSRLRPKRKLIPIPTTPLHSGLLQTKES